MVTVKNMTMAQFADDLQRMTNGYIRVPVEDKTGCSTAGTPQTPRAACRSSTPSTSSSA